MFLFVATIRGDKDVHKNDKIFKTNSVQKFTQTHHLKTKKSISTHPSPHRHQFPQWMDQVVKK